MSVAGVAGTVPPASVIRHLNSTRVANLRHPVEAELHDETHHDANRQMSDLRLVEKDITTIGVVRPEIIDEAKTTSRVKAHRRG